MGEVCATATPHPRLLDTYDLATRGDTGSCISNNPPAPTSVNPWMSWVPHLSTVCRVRKAFGG